jgi:hypothetical protein
MLTPAGVECRYYYADYYRGREHQECRLLAQNPHTAPWRPEDCRTCPVPGILRANACPHMVLEGRITKRFLRLVRTVVVSAVCTKYMVDVPEPHRGCGHCHEERPGAALLRTSKH